MGEQRSFRIRVINGPLKDCVYPSDDRLEIGRSDTADIQLAGRGVSRQHACVVIGDGGVVLLDMLSTNGTWVEGVRVTRHRLEHGDRFIIDDCRFEFELLSPSATPVERPTAPHMSADRMLRQTVDFRGARLHPAVSPTLQPAAPATPQPSAFVDAGGHPYPGNLLADVMLYRSLRLRVVERGDMVTTDNLRRFKALDETLRSGSVLDGPSDRREFQRFTCDLPGTLRTDWDGEDRIDVKMLDINVDGARIEATRLPSPPQGLVWLTLPHLGPDGLRCIVFTARPAWTKPPQMGLVFSGAPSWATRSRSRAEDTQVTPLAELKLKNRSV